MSKMSNEALLLDETREMYFSLLKLYEQEKDNLSVLDMGIALFKRVNKDSRPGGRVESATYTIFDGSVPNVSGEKDYTIWKSIKSPEDKDSDFTMLIEDLTAAYYRTNGGKYYSYTPKLIAAIKEEREE